MLKKKLRNNWQLVVGGIILGLALFCSPLLSNNVSAQGQDWRTGGNGACVGENTDVATIQGITCLVANAFSVVFSLLGIGGFVMLTIAGIRYMFSGGNAQGVEGAKKSITGIIIGLVLVLSSFLILRLIHGFTGISLTELWFPER